MRLDINYIFDKYSHWLTALFTVFCIFSVRWSDFLFWQSDITSRRFVLLLAFGIFTYSLLRKNIEIKLNPTLLFLACGWVLLFIISSLSFVKNSYSFELMSLKHVVAWLHLTFITLILSLRLNLSKNYLSFDKTLNAIVIVFCCISLSTVVKLFFYLFINQIPFTPEVIRNFYVQSDTGLNLFFNGMTLLQGIVTAYLLLLFKVRYNPLLYLGGLFASISTISLVYASGSRQNFFASILTLLILLIYRISKIAKKTRNLPSLLCSLGFIFSLLAIIFSTSIGTSLLGKESYFRDRFIKRTLNKELAGTSQRPKVYLGAIEVASKNIIWGVGPGAFPHFGYNGHDTHNGYLGMLTQTGIMSLVVYLGITVVATCFLWLNFIKDKGNQAGAVPFILMTTFLFLINFNDFQFSMYPTVLVFISSLARPHENA